MLEMNWHVITRLISRIKVVLVRVSFPKIKTGLRGGIITFFRFSGLLSDCTYDGREETTVKPRPRPQDKQGSDVNTLQSSTVQSKTVPSSGFSGLHLYQGA